jgi:DNA-binding MarR family transcriptional regulator
MSAHDFGILIGLAYRAFVEELHADLAKHGFADLGPTYGYVVRLVAATPGLRQRDVARQLQITEQGAGKIVDEMVRRRFLARRTDTEDRRARALRLGSRGVELLRTARRFHARFERRLARDLGSGVVAETRRVLEHVVETTLGDAAMSRLRPT